MVKIIKLKKSDILPFYNSEQTLSRAVESIANQTYSNFECILIDNNSTDKSNSIAKKWVSKDDRFILTSEEKQGVVFASNKGFEIANGKNVARMDADDFAYPTRLQEQLKFLDKNIDYGAVGGLAEYIPHSENTDGFKRYVNWSNSIITYKDIIKKQFVEMPLVNPTAMWRKDIANDVGMYSNGDFPEDYEMWLRWLSKGIKIAKIPKVVLKWYDSEKRLTRTNSIYSDESFFKIKTKYLSNWLRENNPFYPNVVVWGASKISRNNAKHLTNNGVEIEYYIDIKMRTNLDKDVIHYKNIASSNEIFILVYMKQEEARKEIQRFLESRGFIEGVNYLLVS
ncbi:MAG: glycosyltransferase [Melioribacteraceae bacterium]|jgi:glycosyltransferase involved in cell wall biosynthesis|nr:glycosyltransferase [Melioribacteraceae bacterium]